MFGEQKRAELLVEPARPFTASVFLEFCGYCGQSNSLIGAMFGVSFTLAGGVLLVTSLRLRQRDRPHP